MHHLERSKYLSTEHITRFSGTKGRWKAWKADGTKETWEADESEHVFVLVMYKQQKAFFCFCVLFSSLQSCSLGCAHPLTSKSTKEWAEKEQREQFLSTTNHHSIFAAENHKNRIGAFAVNVGKGCGCKSDIYYKKTRWETSRKDFDDGIDILMSINGQMIG